MRMLSALGVGLGGAVLALGAVAIPAQAAPATSETAASSAALAGRWVYDGSYSESTCYSLVASYAGPAYCTPDGSKWALYIWVED